MGERGQQSELNSPDLKRYSDSDSGTSETGGDASQNSTVIEMLNQIKSLMDDNHQSYHAQIRQVADKSGEMKHRLRETELQITDINTRLVEFETRLITVEDNMVELGDALTELKTALNESLSGKLDKQAEEILDESRPYLTENFAKLVSACESLEKRVKYTVADLQVLTEEASKRITGVERLVQSTPMPRATRGTESGGKFKSFFNRKESSSDLNFSKRRLPEVPKNPDLAISKPVQEPPKYDGKSSWEAFLEQFEIAAKLDGWSDEQKALFLATSLRGNATLILRNISGNERGDYAKLVAALSSRFGITHQSDLARAKLKTRIKRREESLPELAENVETLTRKAYPDASTELQDVLARDHFIDALYEEDLRLRIRQARPKSLQVALETALELESFQLATRHRTRMLRGAVGNVKRINEEIVQNTFQRNERGVNAESKLEELNGLITQLLKVMKAESRGRSLGNHASVGRTESKVISQKSAKMNYHGGPRLTVTARTGSRETKDG